MVRLGSTGRAENCSLFSVLCASILSRIIYINVYNYYLNRKHIFTNSTFTRKMLEHYTATSPTAVLRTQQENPLLWNNHPLYCGTNTPSTGRNSHPLRCGTNMLLNFVKFPLNETAKYPRRFETLIMIFFLQFHIPRFRYNVAARRIFVIIEVFYVVLCSLFIPVHISMRIMSEYMWNKAKMLGLMAARHFWAWSKLLTAKVCHCLKRVTQSQRYTH
jgi:hypothetical protein